MAMSRQMTVALSRRNTLLSVAALALLACTTAPALAQDYPAKTITIVVPFAAGGGVDCGKKVPGYVASLWLANTT